MKQSGPIKTVLFVLTMVLLLVFLAQKQNNIIPVKPLHGVLQSEPEPHFSWKSFRNSDYQESIERYFHEHYGFREPLIRFYNQYLYDFFRKTYSDEVAIGKDNWSYYNQHVNEYYGTEMYRWYDSSEEACADFDREARLMWKLRGVLQDYGIEFLMFMAPDKGFLYPEHLPDRKKDTTSVNAREYYSAKFDEYGFPYIEMTKWFLELKEADTLPYSLMPQAGAHWGFSAVLAADSLFRLMEQLNGQRFPQMKIGPLRESSRTIKAGDRDLEDILNLMRILPHKYDKLLDAEVTIDRDSATIWPSVLFVGNSFLWRMHDFIPFDDMFSHSEYWFYNSTANFGKDYSEKCNVSELDLLQKLLDFDYVVWFTDGSQMYKVSYGFTEMAMVALCLDEKRVNERREMLMDSLRRDSQTMSSLDDDEISSQLWERANVLILKDPERYFPELAGDSVPKSRNPRINEVLVINKIMKDPDWMRNLSECQTVIQNATLEQVLVMEAQNILSDRPLLRDMPDPEAKRDRVEQLVKEMIEEIKPQTELMERIRTMAQEKGITIEDQTELAARWIVNDKINQGIIVL